MVRDFVDVELVFNGFPGGISASSGPMMASSLREHAAVSNSSSSRPVRMALLMVRSFSALALIFGVLLRSNQTRIRGPLCFWLGAGGFVLFLLVSGVAGSLVDVRPVSVFSHSEARPNKFAGGCQFESLHGLVCICWNVDASDRNLCLHSI